MSIDKIDTHVVIKREDILKYLAEPEQEALEDMLNKIIRGRASDMKTPVNHYYVVNKDEPYAEVIHGIIIGGEAVKYSEMDNSEIRKISYDECHLKCTGCKALCDEMPVGQCRKNLSQAFDNKKLN